MSHFMVTKKNPPNPMANTVSTTWINLAIENARKWERSGVDLVVMRLEGPAIFTKKSNRPVPCSYFDERKPARLACLRNMALAFKKGPALLERVWPEWPELKLHTVTKRPASRLLDDAVKGKNSP